MSHLIQIYTVCPLVFEFSISYSLNLTVFLKICRRKFCRLLLVVKELKKKKCQDTLSSFSDVYVELLHGYHDLDKTLNIHHTDSRKLTIRALYGSGHEVHVVRNKKRYCRR